MNALNKEVFEEYGKKRLKELLERGERPNVIAGFLDYFGNSELALCSDYATPVLVRPWALEAIKQYDLRILCIYCVDPQDVKGQVMMDFAKIEDAEKK